MATLFTTSSPTYHVQGSSVRQLNSDYELSALFDSLSLQQKAGPHESEPPTLRERDVPMSDEESYQSDTSASSHSSAVKPYLPPSPTEPPAPPAPCGLLQAITNIYTPGDTELEHFPTTCGAYLELIFTHREAFAAHPAGHIGCPAGFSLLARALELRAWRADRDADTEAVAAFRHEAWQVSAWLGSGGMWWASK